ncbi:MAG: phospholipase [Verrucomicrobiales bacterium]|nr:phospholipase [Verrucomicrobiales bacterium]
MRKPLLAVFGAVVCLLLSVSARADQSAQSFKKQVNETIGLDYLLYVPADYSEESEKEWPLVVFLHGAGERGADLEKVALHGPPAKVKAGESFPFILASPLCPEGGWWTDEPVLEFIGHLEETLKVDTSRIYLTGLSMGGYGTWHFATRAPERFAAIAPVCGGGIPYLMRWIKEMPVWAFHGGKDTVVPLDESERLIKKLKEFQNEDAKLTVYPEAGHNSWTEAYDTAALYEWLLSHSLPVDN